MDSELEKTKATRECGPTMRNGQPVSNHRLDCHVHSKCRPPLFSSPAKGSNGKKQNEYKHWKLNAKQSAHVQSGATKRYHDCTKKGVSVKPRDIHRIAAATQHGTSRRAFEGPIRRRCVTMLGQ